MRLFDLRPPLSALPVIENYCLILAEIIKFPMADFKPHQGQNMKYIAICSKYDTKQPSVTTRLSPLSLPTGPSGDVERGSGASMLLISRDIYYNRLVLYTRLFNSLSRQTADSVWSRLFPRLNRTDTIRAGVQMSDWEIVAVYLSWIVPLRGGSILLLSDERSEKENSYHISSN